MKTTKAINHEGPRSTTKNGRTLVALRGPSWFICICFALLTSTAIAQDAEYKPPRKWTFGTMGVAMRADLEVYQGGARDEAGEIVIKEKDRLLKWGGAEIKTLDDFCRCLYATKPNDIVEVEISRPKADSDERETLTVKIKLADPKVAYKELYTNLDKRTRSYDWREEPSMNKDGPLVAKVGPLISKHKLDRAWDNLLAAHERELDLWNSYENVSSTDLLLSRPLAAHAWLLVASNGVASPNDNPIEAVKLPVRRLLDHGADKWEPPPEMEQYAGNAQETDWVGYAMDRLDAAYVLKKKREPLPQEQWEAIQVAATEFKFAWRGEPGFDESASMVNTLRELEPRPENALTRAAWLLPELEEVLNQFAADYPPGKATSYARKEILEQFVEGDAVAFWCGSGFVAVGGAGRNVWKGGDITSAVAILDLGGDDEYVDCACTATGGPVQIVIDLGGNDHYRSTTKWGVASGVLGTAIIDDREGNDTYECGDWGIGAAFGGVGLLIDRKGNDRYLGGTNSIGCAAYGVGGVIDLEGNDVYDSHTMSVGVGQPGGVGFVLDHSGDDRYRCNGEEPSGYGTEGEWTGWGIGCGFGWRTLACGGIGLVVDVKGNDIYDAGEFGLGCGYFMAIGAVRDMDGDDIYHSSRYGLAAAAHAGVGLFMDDKGNDTYEGKTAASIGGVWDIVTGYFYDGAGDDNYRCDGLGLGACAQNGFGIFWDAGGADNYRGSASTIGNAGGAEYGGGRLAKNFGIFMDSGGGKDSYPREDRKDNTELVEQEYAIFWDE